MREEYVKGKPFEVEGVEVFNLGDEYVFELKSKSGKKKEYHLTKPHMDELNEYIEAKKKEIEIITFLIEC